ncbi:MAG TPA: response regulator transcription factor [Actinomycetes bacterium]|nr:response regulator transcription factor [Actinomycetes bacterium]
MTQTLGRRTTRTRVVILAPDPVSRAGVASVLRFRGELEMVGLSALTDPSGARADVAVVVADRIDRETLGRVRAIRQAGARVVLLARDLDGVDPLETVDAGVSAMVRRVEASDERLTEAIRVAAAGDGSLPGDLVDHLLQQVGAERDPVEQREPVPAFTHRELRILRLLADGLSTLEIARELAYSERTIKAAVHAMTTRLGLRNRSHAVAFAVRKGLI